MTKSPVTRASAAKNPGYVWIPEGMNFHRPKFDCEKGFGICIWGGWYLVEVDYYHVVPAPSIVAGTIRPVVEMHNNILVIRLPAGIANLPDYKNEDLTTFEIEEDHQIKDDAGQLKTVKHGKYKVEKIGAELVVETDLL